MMHLLRITSLIEGLSLLLLLGIAMPLKYIWDLPLAVRIVGSLPLAARGDHLGFAGTTGVIRPGKRSLLV